MTSGLIGLVASGPWKSDKKILKLTKQSQPKFPDALLQAILGSAVTDWETRKARNS